LLNTKLKLGQIFVSSCVAEETVPVISNAPFCANAGVVIIAKAISKENIFFKTIPFYLVVNISGC
jgi:hypothetical protein